MTIEVFRQDLAKVFLMYQREIEKKFYGLPMTEAIEYRINQELEQLRHHLGRGENNPVWQVKAEVVVKGPGTFMLQPILEGVTIVDRPTRVTRYR